MAVQRHFLGFGENRKLRQILRLLRRRALRRGDQEQARKLHLALTDKDHFEALSEQLADDWVAEKEAREDDGTPVLDAVKEFFSWAWENREEILEFVLRIVALFA